MNKITKLDINADLHNHTKSSDGIQSSLRVLIRAYKEGFNVVSITDHNSVNGYKNLEQIIFSIFEILKEDKSYDVDKILNIFNNVKIIKGTELITSYEGVIVEILGYNFDIQKMQNEINYLQTTVKEKNYECLYKAFKEIIEKRKLIFNINVLEDAYQQILKEGKGGVVGPFFKEVIQYKENIKYLEYIDENNQVQIANTLKLFINKHLYNKNSIFFVDMSNSVPLFKDTIDAIHRAGGQAFLAHAGRYKDKMCIEKYIDNMILCGLDGLEVFYPDHTYDFRKYLLGKARQYNLKVSGGSDDHYSIREGKQYHIGKVAVANIEETKWIQDTIINNNDFFSEDIRIQDLIKESKKFKM